ncbi:MAG: lipopolysaccharide heptosyltransferase II [Elusimicrobia bacterium]|nr:lipopolysaccharide heptosyltransferase II [Elusimicrobiota bacterium]
MTKLLSFIGYILISFIGRTLRIREVNSQEGWKRPPHSGFAFAFWHGEQLIPFFYHRKQKVTVMSSFSKDGEIQKGILRRFGYMPVRGSSTKRAERSLVEMIINVKKGHSAAFAVDGGKGPYKKVKSGIIFLAQKTGLPIIPVSSAAKRRVIFEKAWDKYERPKLFSQAVIAYGNPILVKKNDNIDEKTLLIEDELNKLSEFTHKYYWLNNLAEYLKKHPKPKILIIQPSRIGDIVFSLPTVAAIRKEYPHAWIGYFVDERCAPLLEGNSDIDEVIVWKKKDISLGYFIKMYQYFRSKNIDLSIDLHGLSRSAIMVLFAGAKFRIASSSTNGMRELSWFFSKEIKSTNNDAHSIERNLEVAKYLKCKSKGLEFSIFIPEEVKNKIQNIFAVNKITSEKPIIAIHPGGGWISRRWFPERYSELINRLINELNAQVIMVGGKEGGAGEKGLNEEIISNVKGKVLDLTDQLNLKELAALLSKVNIFVANEAGPMHIANALNMPSIAILGPTNAKRTGPFGNKTIVIQHKVECQPCRKRNCKNKKCMELISIEEVFQAIKQQLNKVRAEN